MAVQARFYVNQLVQFAYNPDNLTVKLAPVSGGKGETNRSWNTATPSGEITLNVHNPDAAAWFKDRLGKPLAITFDDADDVV